MTTAKTKQTVRSLCSEVPDEFVEDFLTRLDEDYFETFSVEAISSHIRMSRRVNVDHRVILDVAPLSNNEFEITLVGYDYPSGLSILCGLVSSFGLDIRTGEIHSFSRRKQSRQPGRIVDILKVGSSASEPFDAIRQSEFERELLGLTDLLATGSFSEARERLNRTLIERVEKMGGRLAGLTSPVELSFDNSSSGEWTLLQVQSEDTFAFLYALSNALAMRGIYIHKVRIRSVNGRATDQFAIVNRWNRKIEDAREQERLRMTVSLIKEFTRFLPEAPDPARALSHFDQFLDKLIETSEDTYPDSSLAFLASNEGMNMLAQLLGSSDFLWDDLLRVHFSELLPSLEKFGKTKLEFGPAYKARLREELHKALNEKNPGAEERKRILNNFKDRQVFLIDAAHVVQQNQNLMDFSYALTDLGEVVLEEAARLSYETLMNKSDLPARSAVPHGKFAIFGLGKFGGREMGYASDFELLFVHDDAGDEAFFESFARLVVDFIEARSHGIFHIDLRLRPYGQAGTWSTSFKQFSKYYSVSGDASPFERQALIKLRWFAGDEDLGRRVEMHRDSFTYSNVPWDWENAMELRRRQMAELVQSGQNNVKYSAGGIVDIEYAVQYLQLLNGNEHPRIRLTSTLDALQELRRLQIIREGDYATLHDAYLFLRNLIDGLRVVRGDATDLVLPPETSEEFKSLARRLGYKSADRLKNAELLAAKIRDWMRKVHEYFVLRFSGSNSEFSRHTS